MLDLKKEYRRIIEKTPIKGKSSELESQIYNAIVELFLQIPQNAKVIFRGAGVHTEELLYVLNKAIPQNHFSILAIVDDALCGDMLENIPIITKQQAASLKYDTVFISSFSYAEEMKTDYDEQKIQILDVYGYLQEKGIFLNAPFYYYQNGCYEIPHYYNNMYQRTLSYEALEYLIDAALELKDFKTAFHYMDIYISNQYPNADCYQNAKRELQDLFIKIRQEITERKREDIVMFWIDAVPYAALEQLPFLYSKKDRSCFFEKAYTNTPYTHPTMHTLFQGYLRIDNYEEEKTVIDENSSTVLSDLYKAGYDFIYIGSDWKKHIAPQYVISDEKGMFMFAPRTSACVKYWQMLSYLLLNKRPLFCLVHSVAETHEPYTYFTTEKAFSYKLDEIFKTGQNKKSYEYFNDQLQFYCDFLGDKTIKIYMSDHGNLIDWNTWKFVENRIHPLFLIEGAKICSRYIKKVFSYVNFKHIVKWILFDSEEEFEKALSEYALIQDVDTYNREEAARYITRGDVRKAMAFRGIVTAYDRYCLIGNGEEYYCLLEEEEKNRSNDDRYVERIAHLREITGRRFIDIATHEDFKASRRLYEDKPTRKHA